MSNTITAGSAVEVKGKYGALNYVAVDLDTTATIATLAAAQTDKYIGLATLFLQNNDGGAASVLIEISSDSEVMLRKVLADGAVWELALGDYPWMSTVKGEALKITATGTTPEVQGHIAYVVSAKDTPFEIGNNG